MTPTNWKARREGNADGPACLLLGGENRFRNKTSAPRNQEPYRPFEVRISINDGCELYGRSRPFRLSANSLETLLATAARLEAGRGTVIPFPKLPRRNKGLVCLINLSINKCIFFIDRVNRGVILLKA
jgi:hypothetical protein